jgi:hypothetical protein
MDADELLDGLSIQARTSISDFQDCFLPDGRLDWDLIRERGIGHALTEIEQTPVELSLGTHYEACPNCGDSSVFREILTRWQVRIKLERSLKAKEVLARVAGLNQKPGRNQRDIQAEIEGLRAVAAETIRSAQADMGLSPGAAAEWVQLNVPELAEAAVWCVENGITESEAVQ